MANCSFVSISLGLVLASRCSLSLPDLLITVADEVCPLLSDCLPLAGMSCTERLSRVFHSFRHSSAQCPLLAVEASPVVWACALLIGCKSFLHGSLTLMCVYRCSLCLSLVGCYVIGGLDGIYDGAEGYRTDAFLGDIVLLIFGATVNDKIHSSRYHWPIVLLYSSGWILR